MKATCIAVANIAKTSQSHRLSESEQPDSMMNPPYPLHVAEDENLFYLSARDAAIAAALEIANSPSSSSVEYASTIYFYGSKVINGEEIYLYGYTPPKTDNKTTSVASDSHLQSVGVIHTHPNSAPLSPLMDYPSLGDIISANETTTRSYVVGPSRTIIEYDPDTLQTTIIAINVPINLVTP